VLNWQGLRATVVDEFVLAHLIGWWAKALIIRNYFILWVRARVHDDEARALLPLRSRP